MSMVPFNFSKAKRARFDLPKYRTCGPYVCACLDCCAKFPERLKLRKALTATPEKDEAEKP